MRAIFRMGMGASAGSVAGQGDRMPLAVRRGLPVRVGTMLDGPSPQYGRGYRAGSRVYGACRNRLPLAAVCFCPNSDRRLGRVQVVVRDNNIDQALKALKKKLQREGVFREMKLRRHYEKPSERRAREAAEAVRRARKVERKRLEREGF